MRLGSGAAAKLVELFVVIMKEDCGMTLEKSIAATRAAWQMLESNQQGKKQAADTASSGCDPAMESARPQMKALGISPMRGAKGRTADWSPADYD